MGERITGDQLFGSSGVNSVLLERGRKITHHEGYGTNKKSSREEEGKLIPSE